MPGTTFTEISQLRPSRHQVDLRVQVITQLVSAESQHESGKMIRVAEYLVGDESGSIVLKAMDDQIDLLQPQSSVTLRNARVEMVHGHMRLVVDRDGVCGGSIEADWTGFGFGFAANTGLNMSVFEWEYVVV